MSEPLLALAAHELIEEVANWDVLIDKYIQAQYSSCTHQGFRGELACQILLLMASRKCVKCLSLSNPLDAVPLVVFVQVLFGNQIIAIQREVQTFLDGLREFSLSEEEMKAAATFFDSARSVLATDKNIAKFIRDVVSEKKDSIRSFELAYPEAPKIKTQGLRALKIMYQKSNGKICDILESILSLIALKEMEEDFKHARVRVNQFVRTFKRPSRAMLIEHFLRASGIATRELQPVADLIGPIVFKKENNSPITLDDLGLFALDAKLRGNYHSLTEKREWLNSFDSFDFLKQNSHYPILGIFCELGKSIGAEAGVPSVSSSPRLREPASELVVWRRTSTNRTGTKTTCFPVKYGFFTRRLSVKDIFPENEKAIKAFESLLETRFDPSESRNVESSFKQPIKHMFRTQPYMQSDVSAFGRISEY